MLMRFFLLVLVLVVPSMAQATVLFTEKFDSYGTEAQTATALQSRYVCSSLAFGRVPWIDGDAQDVDSSQKFSGSFSNKQHYTGSQYDNPTQGGGSCEYDFDADYPDPTIRRNIWITWYHRFGTGFQTAGGVVSGVSNTTGSATKGLYLYMKSPSTGDVHGWVFHYFYGGRQLTMSAQGIKDHKGPNGPGTGTAIPYDTENMWQNVTPWSQPDNQWVCYEANFKLNTPGQADGQYLLYVTPPGGQTFLSTSITNREFVDSDNSGRMPGDSAWFRFKYYRQDGVGDMWYDDSYVSNTRIGCAGTPPVSDTTAPSQVTGLSSPTKTSSTVNLSWTAATDNVGVVNYIVQSCTGAACTNFGTIGTPIGTTFTHTGRSASTLYRYRVAAQDAATNVGTYSSIVDVTTSAATTLPTVTAFTTTSAGGTITYTGSPASFRIAFGGNTGTSSEVILTAAQVPSGVLTFAWPADTTWACAHARDGGGSEDPVAYVCNSVTPAPPGGTSSGVLRRVSSTSPWLTLDGSTGRYVTGISGGDNCNASFCGVQDALSTGHINLTQDWKFTDTFDGTAADIGTSWNSGYTAQAALSKSSGVLVPSSSSDSMERYTGVLADNQTVEFTVAASTGAGAIYQGVGLRFADEPTISGVVCTAMRNAGGMTSNISSVSAGSWALINENNTVTWAANDVGRCETLGSTVNFYRNGVLVVTGSYTARRSGSAIVQFQCDVPAECGLTSVRIGNVASDYVSNLNAITSAGSNFVRYWTLEQPVFGSAAAIAAGDDYRIPLDQMPWQYTGIRTDTSTGTSVQVGVYNLDVFNQSFYDRVRARVQAALVRGITPSVMLFSGGHLNYSGIKAGFSHPFVNGNNTNGISCDTDADGDCEESHTLSNVNITNYQKAYVRKMVDTLNDLDGFIWEISNEDQFDSTAWHTAILSELKTYEATKPKTHLRWASAYNFGSPANNNYLFNLTDADIISPTCTTGGDNYDTNPPYATGAKVIFNDTDHATLTCGTEVAIWPWKTFTRGHYPVFLSERESSGVQTTIKTAMAQTLTYANKINLYMAYPEQGTTYFSTGYGLFTGTNNTTANCSEYLMLMPTDGSSTINLTSCGTSATFTVEYFNLTSGVTTSGGTINGGASRSFNPAGSDPMVVYLKSFVAADTTPPMLSSGSPSGVQAAGTTSVSMQATTDENATCKYSLTDVAYGSMAGTFSTTGTMSHSQTISGLSDGNTYTYYVRCTDVAGNANTSSYTVTWSVTALAPDVAPPVRTAGAPSGVLVDSTTSTTMSLTTDENATCKYGTVAETAYASIASTFTTTGTTSHSQSLTGLTNSTTYTYYIRCVDGSANANVTDYVITFQIAAPSDTSAPILSGGGPSTIQPAGTTEVTLTVTTNKNATCKFDSTIGTTYASMGTTFGTTGALLHTHTLSGLSDGTAYVRYVRCIGAVSGVANTTDYVIGFSVASAAAGLPADVVNVRGSSQNSQTAIFWQWDAATNADHYIIEISLGGSFVSAIETANASTFYLQTGLSYGSYNARVKAVNTDGVTSTNWGSSLPVNVVLPPTLTGVQAVAYSNSVVLSWNAVSDTGLVAIFERCTGAACTSFDLPRGVSATSFVDNTVSPGTTYGYRGVWSNPTLGGTSTTWSTTVYVTTVAAAASPNDLTRARTPVPFGQPRLPRN